MTPKKPRTYGTSGKGRWCVYVGTNGLQPDAFFYTAREDVPALLAWCMSKAPLVKIGAEGPGGD